jgi:hypothetical protein
MAYEFCTALGTRSANGNSGTQPHKEKQKCRAHMLSKLHQSHIS